LYAGRPINAMATTLVRNGVAPNRPERKAFALGSRSRLDYDRDQRPGAVTADNEDRAQGEPPANLVGGEGVFRALLYGDLLAVTDGVIVID